MTFYSIDSPYPTILGLNGSGLNNGKVYIGQAGQDPEAFPIDVFWDEAGTVLAAQPLMTIGGYIYNAGTPASVYTDSVSYSMRVRDKNGVQVFYSADVNNAISTIIAQIAALVASLASTAGAAMVGWIRSATGAIAKTVSVKLGYRIDAEDFLPNGWNPGADDVTSGIQAAINNAASTGRILYLPPAFKAGALIVPPGAHLRGVGKKTVLTNIAGSYIGFTIQGSDTKIQDLMIMAAAKSGGVDYHFQCGTTTMRRVTIQDVISFDSYGFMSDSGTGDGFHIGLRLMHCETTRLNGPGIVLTRAFAYCVLEDPSIDWANVLANHKGISFNGSSLGSADAGGVVVRNAFVGGSASQYTTGVSGQRAYEFISMASVQIPEAEADGCGEEAFHFENVNALRAGTLICSLGVAGITFKNVTNSTIDTIYTSGRNYLTYKPANKDGVFFDVGNSAIKIGQIFARDWTGNGINKAAAQAGPILIDGVMAQLCTLNGVKTVGLSGFNIGCASLGGNVVHDLDLGGTADNIRSAQISSGAVNNYVGPVTA